MNPANAVTITRMFVALVVFYMLFVGQRSLSVVLFVLFIIMDGLDGWLARRYHCETKLGKNLDFIADGLGGIGVLIVLVVLGEIPLLFILLGIPPAALMILGLYFSTKLTTGTFVASTHRKLTGATYYAMVISWMLGDRMELLAYACLAVMYVLHAKYLQEIMTSPISRQGQKKAT